MKTKDMLAVSTTALCSAALTVLTFGGGHLEAGGEGEPMTPKIDRPTLLAHGVELSMAAANARVFKAGEKPVFELTAVNTTGQAQPVSLNVTMTGLTVADMISRVARPQKALWQEPFTFTVPANETKTITLTPDTTVPDKSLISVWLMETDPAATQVRAVANPLANQTLALATDAQPRVVVLNFSTMHSAPQTGPDALASVK